MESRTILLIVLGALLGVFVCIAYCALVEASKEESRLKESREHIKKQREHVKQKTSTKGENQ